jgi:ATP-binding cassette subfamily B protein
LEERWSSKALLLLQPTGKLHTRALVDRSKWSWLSGIIKKDLDLLYLAAFLGLLVAVLNLSTAVFSQKLVDVILPRHQSEKVLLASIFFGLVLLCRTGISRLRSTLLIKQSYRFNLHLTSHFFGTLLYLPKPFFDGRRTGDLTSRLNDISRIQQAVSYIIGDVGVQALFLLVSLGMIFSYSLLAGCICLLVLPLQFVVIKRHEHHLLTGYRDAMKANAVKESNYIDTIKGIGTIKVLNQEPLFIETGKTKMDGFQQELLRLGHRRIKFAFSSDLVVALFTLCITLSCAMAVLNGSLKTGEWIAIMQMAVAFLQAAVALALTNLQLQEAKAALERIVEFNHIQPDHLPQPDTGIHPPEFSHLRIRELMFRFRGQTQLLRNVSLDLAKGEIITIEGESGQGKSTLFQVLQKLYLPESGQILVNNQDWSDCDTIRWRRMIGVVPQDITVFGGTLLENIAFDDAVTQVEKVLEFCRRYGFDKHFSRLRHGGRTILGEGGIRLSGGEKQLLALARCLYRQPGLLLLDEPTSAMDTALHTWVMQLLQKVREQTGIIVVSHGGEWSAIANRRYCLDGGVLKEKSFHVR